MMKKTKRKLNQVDFFKLILGVMCLILGIISIFEFLGIMQFSGLGAAMTSTGEFNPLALFIIGMIFGGIVLIFEGLKKKKKSKISNTSGLGV